MEFQCGTLPAPRMAGASEWRSTSLTRLNVTGPPEWRAYVFRFCARQSSDQCWIGWHIGIAYIEQLPLLVRGVLGQPSEYIRLHVHVRHLVLLPYAADRLALEAGIVSTVARLQTDS